MRRADIFCRIWRMESTVHYPATADLDQYPRRRSPRQPDRAGTQVDHVGADPASTRAAAGRASTSTGPPTTHHRLLDRVLIINAAHQFFGA